MFLHEIIKSTDTDATTIAQQQYIKDRVMYYVRLSEMGNAVTALEVEDQCNKFIDKLEKILPALKLTAPLLKLLEHDWIIYLLFFKHTTVSELQAIEKSKPVLFEILGSKDVPQLLLQINKLKLKEFVEADDTTLRSIDKLIKKPSATSNYNQLNTLLLAEATHSMLFQAKVKKPALVLQPKATPHRTGVGLSSSGSKANR